MNHYNSMTRKKTWLGLLPGTRNSVPSNSKHAFSFATKMSWWLWSITYGLAGFKVNSEIIGNNRIFENFQAIVFRIKMVRRHWCLQNKLHSKKRFKSREIGKSKAANLWALSICTITQEYINIFAWFLMRPSRFLCWFRFK